jgi:hypothetical protein
MININLSCINGYLDTLQHFGQGLKPLSPTDKGHQCPNLRDEGGKNIKSRQLDKEFYYQPDNCNLEVIRSNKTTELEGKDVNKGRSSRNKKKT